MNIYICRSLVIISLLSILFSNGYAASKKNAAAPSKAPTKKTATAKNNVLDYKVSYKIQKKYITAFGETEIRITNIVSPYTLGSYLSKRSGNTFASYKVNLDDTSNKLPDENISYYSVEALVNIKNPDMLKLGATCNDNTYLRCENSSKTCYIVNSLTTDNINKIIASTECSLRGDFYNDITNYINKKEVKDVGFRINTYSEGSFLSSLIMNTQKSAPVQMQVNFIEFNDSTYTGYKKLRNVLPNLDFVFSGPRLDGKNIDTDAKLANRLAEVKVERKYEQADSLCKYVYDNYYNIGTGTDASLINNCSDTAVEATGDEIFSDSVFTQLSDLNLAQSSYRQFLKNIKQAGCQDSKSKSAKLSYQLFKESKCSDVLQLHNQD